MKVLVTGAGGFLGSAVVERLLLHGHDVSAVARGLHHRVNELVRLQSFDLNDRERLFKEFAAVRPEAVVHCAGMASTPDSVKNPERCFDDNLFSAMRVLETSREFGCRRAILASSNVVYGSRNPYRAAKLAMEAVAESYPNTLCLRYGNLFGEGARRGFVAAAVAAWRAKRPIRLTDPTVSRHFVHVDDAAEATAIALSAGWMTGWTDVAPDRATFLGNIVEYLPGLEVSGSMDWPGDARHLPQGHCCLLGRWTDVREWLCTIR